MVVILLGMVIDAEEEQLEKAPRPMVATLLGMMIYDKEDKP